MSETLAELIERHRDPAEREKAEKYLERLGDREPVTTAYWRAILAGDQTRARIVLIYDDIFKLKEKAKTDPLFAEILADRIKEVRELEAAAK